MTSILYDGKIRLDYKDKSHYYGVRERLSFDADPLAKEGSAEFKRAWGPSHRPKGTTTLIGDTLEKNGLMTWPMGMALQELFGFYKFEGSNGDKLAGYMKEKALTKSGKLKETGRLVGTMWMNEGDKTVAINPLNPEEAFDLIASAQSNHTRKKKKGADIGSVVHDAIEHYILEHPNNEDFKRKDGALGQTIFDIGEQYMWSIKDSEYESEKDRIQALEDFEEDVKCANLAFESFVVWWEKTKPELYGAEQLLYSMKHDVSGTYDGDIGIKAEHHPVFHDLGQKTIRVTADWKTSKASTSLFASMPEGIGYSYFIQDAIYEIQRREMGMPPADDLLVVSARKDGGFTLLYASELGLTVGDCIAWAESVILCYKFMSTAKEGIWEHYYANTPDARPVKKGREAKAKKV